MSKVVVEGVLSNMSGGVVATPAHVNFTLEVRGSLAL